MLPPTWVFGMTERNRKCPSSDQEREKIELSAGAKLPNQFGGADW